MTDIFDLPLPRIAEALRRRELSALELTEACIARHGQTDASNGAYKHFDPDSAREDARGADRALGSDPDPPPLCGIPISVKDLYGVAGMPTFAGTARRLGGDWEEDAWLVGRLRAQGAVFMGKTHTVELAYGAVGINPHWGTPRNPWDALTHRIPGGSSCGAGVSLWAGSALLALGSDTGGSIRIPASMTGTVGHKTTYGRWPVTGVVPLSATLDTVGALARSVEDSAFFFGAVDPAWGDPRALRAELERTTAGSVKVGVPRSRLWSDCQGDIADVLHGALEELATAGWERSDCDGSLIDAAGELYRTGGIAGAECLAFVERELPGWLEILHPTVGRRLEGSPSVGSETYSASIATRKALVARSDELFERAEVLALPTAIVTPPPVSDLDDLARYGAVNQAALAPTTPISMLGLCALSIPVGLDHAGMPVGLQLVAPAGRDERLLAAARAAERALGSARERLGTPPNTSESPS